MDGNRLSFKKNGHFFQVLMLRNPKILKKFIMVGHCPFKVRVLEVVHLKSSLECVKLVTKEGLVVLVSLRIIVESEIRIYVLRQLNEP